MANLLLLCCCVVCSLTWTWSKECPSNELTFARPEDHVVLLDTLPNMQYFSICQYFTTNSKGNIMGVFRSYTTKENKNLFRSAGIITDTGMVIELKTGENVIRGSQEFPPNSEIHNCLVIDTVANTVEVYIHGEKGVSRTFRNLDTIPGDGEFRLGGTKNPSLTGYVGKMRGVMLWDRKLSAKEVEDIYKLNNCPPDAIVEVSLQNVRPFGFPVPRKPCPSIEYTFSNASEAQYLERITKGELSYSSLCIWIIADSNGDIPGTISTVVLNGQLNTILAEGVPGLFRLGINGQIREVAFPRQPYGEQHLCVLLHLPQDYVELYRNGLLGPTLRYENVGNVPSGGITIIGQAQGCEGGCIDLKRAYVGKIRNAFVWNRLLSNDELQALHSGMCPVDIVVDHAPESIIPHGRIFPYSACIGSELIISNSDDSEEYVEYIKKAPRLESGTICSWLKTDENGIIPGAYGSYAVGNDIDVVGARGEMINGKASLRVYIHGQSKVATLPLTANTEHHLCILLKLKENKVSAYVNGNKGEEFTFRNLRDVPEGGKIILGQRQRCLGGCFEEKMALKGKIRNFTIWDRILSAEEIKAIATLNECPVDHVVTFTPKNVAVHKRRKQT